MMRFQDGTPEKLVTFCFEHTRQMPSIFCLKSGSMAMSRDGVRTISATDGLLLSRMADKSPFLAPPPESSSTLTLPPRVRALPLNRRESG